MGRKRERKRETKMLIFLVTTFSIAEYMSQKLQIPWKGLSILHTWQQFIIYVFYMS